MTGQRSGGADLPTLSVGGAAPVDVAAAIAGAFEVVDDEVTADGTWRVFQGRLLFTQTQALLEKLTKVPAALVVYGPSGDAGVILLAEGGAVTHVPFGAGVELLRNPGQTVSAAEALASWSQRFTSHALSVASARRLLRDLNIRKDDAASDLVLRRLRLRTGKPRRPRLPYGQMRALADPAARPQHVGDELVDWNSERWLLGFGDDDEGWFAGIWDRDHPESPVRRFRKNPDKPREALGVANELVMSPILQRTRLEGVRLWASLPEKWPPPGVILHWAPDGHLALHTTEMPPRTVMRTPGPTYHVNGAVAERFGHPTGGRRVVLELETLDDAILAASYRLVDQNLGWQPLPDSVPRGLVETADWINEQLGAEPAWRWA